MLSAVDPANVFGASVEWPEHETGRPARRTGSYVLLADGALVGYVERGGRSVLTFDHPDVDVVAGLLTDLAARRPGRTTIEKIDGIPSAGTPLGAALERAGFGVGYKGLAYRPTATHRARG